MQRERLPGSLDGEELVSFFIPPAALKGSRDDKLRRLDARIDYLERLRGRLVETPDAPPARYEGPAQLAQRRGSVLAHAPAGPVVMAEIWPDLATSRGSWWGISSGARTFALRLWLRKGR